MAQQIVMRGSVVLIRYPFTDLTGVKVRPAIVLTSNRLLPILEDIICLFISSVVHEELLPTDFILDPKHPFFLKTGLKQRSVLRAHKLTVLHKSLVLRLLGKIDKDIMDEINRRLEIALGLLR